MKGRGENMCSSFQFVEQQAFEMSERIRKESIFKFVRVEVSGISGLVSQETYVHSDGCARDSTPHLGCITKVILEDEQGVLYTVEPSIDGLRFAKGEITYKEYRKREKKETTTILSVFLMAVGLISVIMSAVKWYFI
jgi:hypothetical protein